VEEKSTKEMITLMEKRLTKLKEDLETNFKEQWNQRSIRLLNDTKLMIEQSKEVQVKQYIEEKAHSLVENLEMA